MKICPSCNNNNEDDAVFCTSCGNNFAPEAEQEQSTDTTFVQQPAEETNKNERIVLNFSKNGRFVSEDEYVVATLSNGIVDNLLSGEGFKTEGATLTNKRLYYNHKRGIINIRRQEEKVDIKDITGTKIATFNPVGLLILPILLVIVAVLGTISTEEPSLFLPLILPAFVLFLIYLFAKKSHLKIEYAGGAIYFSVKKYGKENIRSFQKAIHAVKDYIGKDK